MTMLKSCNSICCCFLRKKEILFESNANEKSKVKHVLSSQGNTDGPKSSASIKSEDDVKVICEANIEHILSRQNGSQNSIYRFVSSTESMTMSLHESIIEEEELDDAEICDSIVYVVDGDPKYKTEYEACSVYSDGLEADDKKYREGMHNDNSGSGYSSDVTVIDVSTIGSSVIQCSKLPIISNLSDDNEDNHEVRKKNEKPSKPCSSDPRGFEDAQHSTNDSLKQAVGTTIETDLTSVEKGNNAVECFLETQHKGKRNSVGFRIKYCHFAICYSQGQSVNTKKFNPNTSQVLKRNTYTFYSVHSLNILSTPKDVLNNGG